MKQKILGILVVTLLITSLLGSLVNANIIKNGLKEGKDNTSLDYNLDFDPMLNISDNNKMSSSTVQLTRDDLNVLEIFLNNMKDGEEKEKLQDIFDEIISADGILDLDAVKSIAQSYFTETLEMAGTEIICDVCDEPKVLTQPFGTPLGTSTVFEPPYTSCWSWGDRTGGADDYAHSCSQYSGSIGAYASGWIGGATAEAMQKLSFYVGRTKTISVDAKIIYMGGGSTVGIGAFAGTEKTWKHDDNYGRADLDSPWDWNDIIFKIIHMVALLAPGAPANIKEAIEMIGLIADVEELGYVLDDLITAGDAEVKHATFSFSASPGWHTLYAGMRASASGCVTGTGVAVAAGQVASFTLDGYAAPGKPDVYGPTVGGPGENLEWRVFGNDPNRDPVQFKFDFGDGTTSDWTEFIKDGSLYKSHIYENKGSYQLKVKSRDCDLMESDWTTKEITIKEPERPGDLRIFIVNLGGWTNLHPGETKYGGYFVVQNQGDLLLRWEISDWPDWGTWDFAPDYGDTHGGYGTTVHVIVTAPNVKKGVWTGEIKVVNKDNSDDFEILVVSMTTPKNKASNTPLFNILKNVLQNYPNLFPLLQQLFQRFFNL